MSAPDLYGARRTADGKVQLTNENYRQLLDDAQLAPIDWLLPRELQGEGPEGEARRQASLGRLYGQPSD